MNIIYSIKNSILKKIQEEFGVDQKVLDSIQISLNVDRPKEFGDLNCNAALILSKKLNKKPKIVAEQIKKCLAKEKHIEKIEIAGPGFINIYVSAWKEIAQEIFDKKEQAFVLDKSEPHKKYLVEYVSANPTGPLHLGHGRGGIIGDVLANVLQFLGHKADREFYINDAGSQITKLGRSLKIRCQQELELEDVEFPDDGYAGEYLIDLAKQCVEHYGKKILEQEDSFFEDYAKDELLERIKKTLDAYGITFDRWFSEQRLHKDGSVEKAIESLRKKNLAYDKDDATWFKSTDFNDDKDRVIKKADGSFTYIAADIAYHKDKFDRGYNVLINVLGQDHHGYVKRLKGTMQALGFNADNLDVILYQLVSIKQAGEQVKMSKRAGTFEKLSDVIEKVGTDVARFFYLNRKADAHLDFDLDTALKKTEENPVYYIQYAYVRTNSLLDKAKEEFNLKELNPAAIGPEEIPVIKKICALADILRTISNNYQIHMLAYYTLELAQIFHNYYAHNMIIDKNNVDVSMSRLFVTKMFQETLSICLDLLGLSKPKRM